MSEWTPERHQAARARCEASVTDVSDSLADGVQKWVNFGVWMASELPDALTQIEQQEKHITWMAQTIHQAYHQDQPGTWRDCPKNLCASTRTELGMEQL